MVQRARRVFCIACYLCIERHSDLLRTANWCSCYLTQTRQMWLSSSHKGSAAGASLAAGCPCHLLEVLHVPGSFQHSPPHNIHTHSCIQNQGSGTVGGWEGKVRRAKSIHDNLKVAIITFTWKLPENELHVPVWICKHMQMYVNVRPS